MMTYIVNWDLCKAQFIDWPTQPLPHTWNNLQILMTYIIYWDLSKAQFIDWPSPYPISTHIIIIIYKLWWPTL